MYPLTRRAASLRLAALVGGAGVASALVAPGAAWAQRTPAEGRDFIRLVKPVPLPPSGKIEVVEFFWYGCPHCYAFEPFIEPWIAKLPPDVHFSRTAYGFDDVLREVHQRVFYTLDVMNLIPALHATVFDRFHKEKRPINSLGDMVQFARETGLDADRVQATWNGFAVESRIRLAKAQCEAWTVDFVPLVGVQGRFLATPRTDADGPRALVVTDSLIDLVRKGA